MADKDKRAPEWFDPWGLRGSIREPLSLLGEAARLVGPGGQSLAWVMTTAARRMRGTRIEIRRDPLIAGRVAEIGVVMPARSIPIPGISTRIALWKRAEFSLDRVEIGGKPIDRVDVRASDIAVADSSAQMISVGHVDMVMSISEANLVRWIDALQFEAELDFYSGTAVVRPVALFRWLRVIVEPVVWERQLGVRTTAVGVGWLRLPLPARLRRPRVVEVPPLPHGLEMTGVRVVDGRHVELDIEGRDLKLAVDIVKVITDIGVEGTMSVVRVLRL